MVARRSPLRDLAREARHRLADVRPRGAGQVQERAQVGPRRPCKAPAFARVAVLQDDGGCQQLHWTVFEDQV